jgi:hypothetical protein
VTTGVVSAAAFRVRAASAFAFLESRGFARSPADELDSPVGGSVVYAGRNVGFLVGLDLRDALVEVRVARSREGRLVSAGPDGYGVNLLQHLAAHCGYRGRGPLAGTEAPRDEASLERVLTGWADFLRAEGGALLADDAGSLPG